MHKTKLFNLGISLFMTMPIMNLFQLTSSTLGILELHVVDSTYHKEGHVYLRYHNLTTTSFHKIGYDSAGPGNYLTIGRWNSGSSGSSSSSGADGPGFKGVYYNREEFLYERISNIVNDFYVSLNIDNVDEFNALSAKVAELNNGYSPLSKNCGHFAYDVWNVVAEENEKLSKSFIKPDTLGRYLKSHPYLQTYQEDFSDYHAAYYTYYKDGVRNISRVY